MLTGFAKLLLTTNFKFGETSNESSAEKITNAVGILHCSVFVKNTPASWSGFKVKTSRCKM
jgi:hypothetical protein